MEHENSSYEVIDHTADIGIKARGKSLEEVFKAVAKGMFDLIAKDDNIEPREAKSIEIEIDDLIILFKRWLEELLFIFDTEKLVFSKFQIQIDKKNNFYKLKAVVYGEKYNPEKHGSGVEIKAVTYHMMDIWEEDNYVYARVLFDI